MQAPDRNQPLRRSTGGATEPVTETESQDERLEVPEDGRLQVPLAVDVLEPDHVTQFLLQEPTPVAGGQSLDDRADDPLAIPGPLRAEDVDPEAMADLPVEQDSGRVDDPGEFDAGHLDQLAQVADELPVGDRLAPRCGGLVQECSATLPCG
jgi:hypothetical protein